MVVVCCLAPPRSSSSRPPSTRYRGAVVLPLRLRLCLVTVTSSSPRLTLSSRRVVGRYSKRFYSQTTSACPQQFVLDRFSPLATVSWSVSSRFFPSFLFLPAARSVSGAPLTQRTLLRFNFRLAASDLLFSTPRIALKNICVCIYYFFHSGDECLSVNKDSAYDYAEHRNSELTAIAQEVTQLEYS